MNGATFRRQTPIGPYIVDFVCHAAKLVIEIDGGQHFESRQEQRDARRDAYLANKGFRVLRFNNHDVMTNREGVLETIAAAVGLAPSLTLQPKRDGNTLIDGETGVFDACGQPKSNIARLVARPASVA